MSIVVHDPSLAKRLLDERKASGGDRYDEVWEGVYMLSPMAGNAHQRVVLRLARVLQDVVEPDDAGEVFAGVNLSDRWDDWEEDYRVPDIAVFLRRGGAEDLDSHWRGPADFLVEVTSPGDQTRERLPFYGRLGVRELLIVDRDPWGLEMYRVSRGKMRKAAQAGLKEGEVRSAVLGLAFRLVASRPRARIEVKHLESGQSWRV